MIRLFPLFAVLGTSACREPTFTPQPDSDCAESDCDTDTDSDPDTDTGLPCEPVTMEGGSLETSDCRERPDPFQVRLEWELRPYSSGDYRRALAPRLDTDTGTSEPGWMRGFSNGSVFVRGDGTELVPFTGEQIGGGSLAALDVDSSGNANFLTFHGAGELFMDGPGEHRPVGDPGLSLSALGRMNVADLDLDGEFDLFQGAFAVAMDGSVLSDATKDPESANPLSSTVADVDGDGRREIVSYDAIRSEYGGLQCQMPDPLDPSSTVVPMDVDADGTPEILVVPNNDTSQPLRLLNGDCEVLLERGSLGADEGLTAFSRDVLVVAPLLEPSRPAVALRLYAADETGARFNSLLILDDELKVRQFMSGARNQPWATAADTDGNGVHELFVHGLTPAGELRVMNVPSGTSQTLLSDGVLDSQIADVDGDHHAELIVTRTEDEGSYLQVYGGVGPEWQPATPTWTQFRYAAWVQNPDGSPTAEPVDWSRVGMLNASPSFAWWWGVGGNLVVDIADVCEDRCDEGRLTAWVRVGNDGVEEVGRPVRVDVYGVRGDQEELVGSQTYDRVPSGVWLPAEPLEITFEGEPFDALRAEVAGDGWTVDECDAADNTASLVITCD